MTMNVIEEIKAARKNLLTDEQKQGILAYVKKELTTSDYCVIDGASHYSNQTWARPYWDKTNTQYSSAPFSKHPAIAEYLQSLGFRTSRYYNRGGVDNGLKVWIP